MPISSEYFIVQVPTVQNEADFNLIALVGNASCLPKLRLRKTDKKELDRTKIEALSIH